MPTGAGSPQDLTGGAAAEGEGEEGWGERSWAWLTAEGVHLPSTQERRGLMWRAVGFCSLLCVV